MLHFQREFAQWDLQSAANPEHREKTDLFVTAFDVTHMIAVDSGDFGQFLLRQAGIGTHSPQGIPKGNILPARFFMHFFLHTCKLLARG